MSGGRFDYTQSRLLDVSDNIKEVLDRQNTALPDKSLIFRREHYKKYPEDAFYPMYSGEVQKRFREAIYCLKKAYIYAQRVDWFLSGDDGEKEFLEGLEKELKELENEK